MVTALLRLPLDILAAFRTYVDIMRAHYAVNPGAGAVTITRGAAYRHPQGEQ